jgi:hypothetical protein
VPDGPSKYLAEFLEFVAAREAAEHEDNDPDNGRDITLQKGDQVLTIPFRLAKQFDLDGYLGSTFGIKRKAAPAGKAGDNGAGDGDGAAGGGKPGNVRDFFKGAGKQPPAATGS